MIWLTWRQHRLEGLMTLGVLAVIGVFLLLTGRAMATSFQQLGLSHCLSLQTPPGSPCPNLIMAFGTQYGLLQLFDILLIFLPLLLGTLVGAPLVAREVEQHTHLLVWTQSITRTRWLTVKLALVLGAGLLASGALLAVLIWWYRPWAQLDGSFGTNAYDTSGPVWVAETLLALALGVLAGTLTRRVAPAIFLTIVLFVAIRVPVASLWRPNFEAPITQTTPIGQVNNNQSTLSSQDWVIAQGYIDAQGNKHDGLVGCTSNQTSVQCFQVNGAQALFVSYQPADRFWTFQWIETGIYVGFSVLALFAAFWLVRRRLN
jgi:ABC-type transport system involved in multi-copper enzyme maturation permease subunit